MLKVFVCFILKVVLKLVKLLLIEFMVAVIVIVEEWGEIMCSVIVNVVLKCFNLFFSVFDCNVYDFPGCIFEYFFDFCYGVIVIIVINDNVGDFVDMYERLWYCVISFVLFEFE